MQTRLKKWLPLLLAGAFILLIDQMSKAWVMNTFAVGEGLAILPPFLQITRSINTGIAFGIGEGGSTIFLVLSTLIILVLLGMYWRSKSEAQLQHWAYGLVVGGALGNVLDRLQHGHVVDWVHLRLPDIASNVSNFADHAIVIGVLLLLLENYLQERNEQAAEKSKIVESPSAEPLVED